MNGLTAADSLPYDRAWTLSAYGFFKSHLKSIFHYFKYSFKQTEFAETSPMG